MLQGYNITHHTSTAYYPKGNGQAEATNKTLIKILAKTVHDNPNRWAEQLPTALWAYRTSKRSPTGATPFSLCYGAEAILPAEVVVPSARLALDAQVGDNRMQQLLTLEERRDKARKHNLKYQQRIARAYNKTVQPRTFTAGDLVLKAADHAMRNLNAPKFAPNWEGPFRVTQAYESGYCKIIRPRPPGAQSPSPSYSDEARERVINTKWLKRYHP